MPGMAHSSAARSGVESLTATWAGVGSVRRAHRRRGTRHRPYRGVGVEARAGSALVSRVIPLLRLQRPDEIAALVGFLISAAGDYITGQTLVADGGWDLVGPAAALAGVDFTS